jgi:hypothetical protein
MRKGGQKFVFDESGALVVGARGPLSIEQEAAFLGVFALFGNVGVGTKPEEDLPALIAKWHRAREKPAIHPVVPA